MPAKVQVDWTEATAALRSETRRFIASLAGRISNVVLHFILVAGCFDKSAMAWFRSRASAPCRICSAFTLPSSHSLFESGQAVTVTIRRAGFQFFNFLQALGGDHPGKVLRFHERTNFDVGVFDHRVREFLHPVNRFLE